LARIRIAYWTPRSSTASWISGFARAVGANGRALTHGLFPFNLWNERFVAVIGVWTLPGRNSPPDSRHHR
jgi:hypothetical protein